MDVLTPLQQERTEVELILRSGLFDKAPRLGKFFCYICDRYFEGQAEQIKEYSIALEALDRPAQFDPKKDSIVRVEAHRLRRRLQDYYRGAGANRPLRICIPNGQYRPHFVAHEAAPALLEEEAVTAPLLSDLVLREAAAISAVSSPSSKAQGPRWQLLLSVVLVVGITATFIFGLARRRSSSVPPSAREVWTGPSAEPVEGEFRILAGYHGSPMVDRQGHTWGADAYYDGGTSKLLSPDRFIEAQPDPHLLRSQRSGDFRYDIPLRQRTYELHLLFAETEFGSGNPGGGGESTRLFQVSLNGAMQLREFDPLAEAGAPNRLHIRVFKDVTPATDGKLHLRFSPEGQPAFLNGIEILPSAPGRIHPIRIVTQATPVTDSDGRLWSADEYFSGGTVVFRRNVVLNGPEKELFQGERYGNFSYRLPLSPGKYRLTLHFAETWFGTPESHMPATGSRIFNVSANGTALLRDYEIATEAGGPNRSAEKVFDHLEPNAQGVLLLEFMPVRNYAEVNAIELVETD